MAGSLLIVRLGSMGDIIHTLPAAAALRRVHPEARLAWLVERRWLPLLEGNPHLNEIRVLDRGSARQTLGSALALRRNRFEQAIDFQGLIKSAVCARLAARRVRGFPPALLREKPAAWLYAETAAARGPHVVDLNMELAGAANQPREFWLPEGRPEGTLPSSGFLLACPLAGWGSKQWPVERYHELRALLAGRGLPLVLNGPPGSGLDHESGLAGLIHATRLARGVVGLDSGPLHLAAALGKAGVAIYGPTDPARNGPYGGAIRVLRAPLARTTYKRGAVPSPEMSAISAGQVAAQVTEALGL